MPILLTEKDEATDAILKVIAYTPTRTLSSVAADGFFKKLSDADFMRIAVHLASKSYKDEGCPIGAVIIDNETRRIIGKGHNTLVQDNDPYNHGETAAIRDAGRRDFSQTTLFTTLSPCSVCTALLAARGFSRVVVGDVTNAKGNEEPLRLMGMLVDILEDQTGIELYKAFRAEKPDLELEDWKGLAAVRKKHKTENGIT